MQALLFSDIRKLEVVDMNVPVIERPDQVLVKVRATGICGSDLHGYTGHSGRRQPPLIMGHETAGEVLQIGTEVMDLKPGDRVAINPVASCGFCAQCRAGRRSICENRQVMGMNAPGAYAEYVIWPAANLFKLPQELEYEVASLAEPLSVCQHAVGLAHIKPYDSAFVVGAGPIGLLTLAVLRQTAVSSIGVSDLSDDRLGVALEMGADYTVNPSKENARAVVEAHVGSSGVDLSFEAVGLSRTSQQTLEVTRNKGTVIWIGNNQKMIEIDMQAIVTRELSVLGSYGMSDQEFERSLQMLAAGKIPTEKLINRYAELAEGPGLFEELLESPETIKCVMRF